MTAAPEAAARAAARAGRPRRIRVAGLVGVLVVLLAAGWLSVAVGARVVGTDAVLAALGGSAEGFDQAAVAKRIPRTVLAMAAGAALGVAGAVMQGVTRNPLADPGILGVTMGASLAVVTGLAFFGLASAGSVVWVAICGAAVTAVFVYVVGSMGRGGATPLTLALAGAATTAALASLVTAVALPRGDISANVRSWQVGGVGGGTWEALLRIWPFLAVGLLVCLLAARALNTLALGDELAAGLGERVVAARAVAAAGAVVLCGAVTAVTGPIGFVGLVVPHACRLLVGVDHRWLLPFSAVAGAALLTLADVAGRVVAPPSEVAVGIVTAFLGAPVFIWIVRRQKVREL
ncbi:FecCD family ABC transporter permease [Pseudonocardia sp. HH130630-07]|uniref:FecCD family ABC transporter permease n=1 Tax=Pseudonocardia sp. HH130630-07 TaxID=1690815 RepID=UPI0008152B51|nr:iron ABC transporter permease [Pseudonocardia sp. HH130630-07]ANY08861.1 iron ABC transporter permease [Pseudonocardia sp. HH130630-07]